MPEISNLIGTLYEASHAPEGWSVFLDQMTDAVGSSHAFLLARADDSLLSKFHLHGFTPAEMATYQSTFAAKDVALALTETQLERHGEWCGPLDLLITQQDFERTEVYNEYCHPVGIHRQACTALSHEAPHSFLGVAVWRGKKSKPFSPDDTRILAMVTPHLQRALRLEAELIRRAISIQMLRCGLDVMHAPMLALDRTGAVLIASEAAMRLLGAKRGLILESGNLRALPNSQDRRLQILLKQVCLIGQADAKTTGDRSSHAVLIHGLLLQAFPFRNNLGNLSRTPAALVFITDRAHYRPVAEEVLRTVYGLTGFQVRVCALLASGEDVREIANKIGITYDTARFHLKRIYRKTGTRKQAELISLLAKFPSGQQA